MNCGIITVVGYGHNIEHNGLALLKSIIGGKKLSMTDLGPSNGWETDW